MSRHLHVKYLLIGAGVAASSAAQAIRQIDPEGSIHLVGMEHTRPYRRAPLSQNFLRGLQPRDEIFTVPVGWFSQNRVELHTGLRAAHLDVNRKSVALADGDVVAYDKLLLATGGSPRHLTISGANLANVHYLRNLDDADRLHNAVEKAKREGRPHPSGTNGRGVATVIGGGSLGVQLAATLTQLGLSIDLVVAAPHPWKKFAGEATGKFIARYLENHNVRVHTAADPSRLDGEGRVQRVVLTDGRTIPADFVVAAIGLTPNKDLGRGTPINAEKAILADAYCRTNIDDVYAAGDCAAVYDPLFAKHRLFEHYDAAALTGAIAGANMAGLRTPFDTVTTFSSTVFDLTLRAFGSSRPVERHLLRGLPNTDSLSDYLEFGVSPENRIVQILTFSPNLPDETFQKLIYNRLNITGIEEQLKDPKVDLTTLL